MAEILDGKKLAQELKDQLKVEVQELNQRFNDAPHLVNLMIGDDPGSRAYANAQKRAAEYIGIKYDLVNFPSNISQEEFADKINALNSDDTVNGIMLHKPVPKQIDYHSVANIVDTNKDLEGINVANIGKMLLGETNIIPCTPAGVMEHIKSTHVDLRGKEAVVVGHSVIVGKPLALLLLEQYATVTVCHVATSEAGALQEHVSRADILIVAVGKAGLIKGGWIKKGAIVIDVGINQVDGKIVGDVEFDAAQKQAAFITPVPGGVGPVTVVMLMRNGIEAFKQQRELKERLNV